MWFPLLAACISFGLLQIDGIERSFLGAPDREMLQTAFKLRDGVARGSGDPVLWLDIDLETLRAVDVAPQTNGPRPYVARRIISTALDYARTPNASLVLLDVDVSWDTRDSEGQALLVSALQAWAKDDKAPLLVLAREAIDLDGIATFLPTPLDELVRTAPNIRYATVNNLSGNGGVREFLAGQCVQSAQGPPVFVPSAVIFAMAAQKARRTTATASAAEVIAAAEADTATLGGSCIKSLGQNLPSAPAAGLISWHIGFSYPNTIKAARVSANWPHLARCALSAPPKVASRISLADILADPQSASKEPLCGHLVIIGADNPIQQDRTATPIGLLPGPIILANAMRGHFDTGPIVRLGGGWLRTILQIGLLVLTVVGVVWAFGAVGALRRQLRSKPASSLTTRAALFVTHPLCFKFVVAFVTFAFGAMVTAWSLNLGFWGLLSAPAYFAALFEAWQQINEEKAHIPPPVPTEPEIEDGQSI